MAHIVGIQTRGRNVLAELDERVPTSFYWSLTLLATLGGFLFGYDTANIRSALPFVPYSLNGFALGYLVAGASLGAAVGALGAGPLADRFGRKSAFIHRFLPETKNRSVEEVAAIFEQEAQGGRGTSGATSRGAATA